MKYKIVLLDTYSGYIEERFDGEMLFASQEEAEKYAQQLNERKNTKNSADNVQYGNGYQYVVICV